MLKTIALLLALLGSVAFVPGQEAGQAPHIIVDTAVSAGTISPLLFGHNIQWWENATFLWDPTKHRVKDAALPILREACRYPATIRFPGGFWGDVIHWRRAVGPSDKRPLQMFYGRKIEQNFGTDEFMMFLRQVSPGMSPLMIVNWWDWNKPERLDKESSSYIEDSQIKGMWEAANWVEYCNGVVTEELLKKAMRGKWEPSRFVDPKNPSRESREPDAVEWADGIHSWRSFEKAPKGYFAWLRRYFAWERAGRPLENGIEAWTDLNSFKEESYGAPYGVQYWEIGNEIYFLDESAHDRYRNTLMVWSEAMKRANDADGWISRTEYTVEEGDPLGRKELGAYNGKKLRIGAVMVGQQESLSEWDKKVLTEKSAQYVEWLAVHPYASVYPDARYAAVLSRPNDEVTSERPVSLQAGVTYKFRIRAKSFRALSGADLRSGYPRMVVHLLAAKTNHQIDLATLDTRRIGNGNEVSVRFPLDPSSTGDEFTDYENDYIYTGTVPVDGEYFVRVKATYFPKASKAEQRIWISFVSYRSENSESETTIEFASEQDQIKAYYSLAARIGKGLSILQTHANKVSPRKSLGLGCTEYRAMFGWAGLDSNHSMKGTIIAADMLREFIEQRVLLANYWSFFLEIIEPWHLGYSAVRNMYLDINGKWVPLPKPNGFVGTGPQQLFELLGKYFGDQVLLTKTPRIGEEDEHYHLTRPFGSIPPMQDKGVPYISAVASASSSRDGRIRKIYVLVINKDWNRDRDWILRFDHITTPPRSIRYHTLMCRDAEGSSALSAINTFRFPNRISIRTDEGLSSDFNMESSTLTHRFPSNSITVVELIME